MAKDLADLRIAVTGGARGIGRATAARLAAAGARVVIGDRDHDVAATVAAELGHGVSALPLDVADPESWQAFVAEAGPLDVLVNNAGIMPLGAILQEPDAGHPDHPRREPDGRGPRHQGGGARHGRARRRADRQRRLGAWAGSPWPAGRRTPPRSSRSSVSARRPAPSSSRSGVEVCLVMPTVVRTDLAAGVPQARFVKQVQPEDVAEAIEATIRKPRPERWVPGWTQRMTKFAQLLPRPVQDGIAKVFKADVLAAVDPAARAAYEAKVRSLGGVPEDERYGFVAGLGWPHARPRGGHRPDQRRLRAARTQPRAARQGPVLRRHVHRVRRGGRRSAGRRTCRATRCR